MKKYHEVSNIRFDQHFLFLTADGGDYQIDLRRISPRLAAASEDAKMNFVLSPANYGIHWPQIDEDLSIDGLIRAATTEGTSISAHKNN
jgi:hypothetical protein